MSYWMVLGSEQTVSDVSSNEQNCGSQAIGVAADQDGKICRQKQTMFDDSNKSQCGET